MMGHINPKMMYEFLRTKKIIFFARKDIKNKLKYLKKKGLIKDYINNEQKKEIIKLYKQYGCNRRKIKFDTYNFLMGLTGTFSKYYIPEDLFREIIEPSLNRKELVLAWADKNMYDKLFPSEAFPNTVVRNINGIFYDNQYNHISYAKACNIICKTIPVFIKKSIENGGGHGIASIIDENDIEAMLNNFEKDYVVQEKIIQHHVFNKINPSSVNVIRILTLLIDNEAVYLSSTLRAGGVDSIIDNYISKDGKGMLVAKVFENGEIGNTAFYSTGETRISFENGEELSQFIIPKHKEMIEIAKSMHRQMPYFKMIGWDMTVDSNNNIVVIEYNIKSIGVLYYQYVNGPLFGEYTETVLKQIMKKKNYTKKLSIV